ncbi:MAG: DUF1080 domain-containing protein [Verrucomicrobia bacterium]|nr:DUF1080 domain-containing protein [Verrucomicrobiota bacterium]
MKTFAPSILDLRRLSSFLFVGCLFGLPLKAAEPGEILPPEVAPKAVRTIAGSPPSDAIILFDGLDLSEWRGPNLGEAKWEVKNDVATVNGTGSIISKKEFADCQLHVEWATPKVVKGDGQDRGNSGIYIQNRYEVQILDSWNNETYHHGSAGSIYKQYAPLANASRPPGEGQTYDIFFHAPRFDPDGRLAKPATITVIHNGVLVQDNVEIKGTTVNSGAPKYTAHPLKMPILLQDHGNPVQFRNIWVRPL